MCIGALQNLGRSCVPKQSWLRFPHQLEATGKLGLCTWESTGAALSRACDPRARWECIPRAGDAPLAPAQGWFLTRRVCVCASVPLLPWPGDSSTVLCCSCSLTPSSSLPVRVGVLQIHTVSLHLQNEQWWEVKFSTAVYSGSAPNKLMKNLGGLQQTSRLSLWCSSEAFYDSQFQHILWIIVNYY